VTVLPASSSSVPFAFTISFHLQKNKGSCRFGNFLPKLRYSRLFHSGIPTLALSKSGSRSKVTPSSQPVYELPLFNFEHKNGSNRSGCFRKCYVLCDIAMRHPYVGIIQIRLPVEGYTFLSARITSSRVYVLLYTIIL